MLCCAVLCCAVLLAADLRFSSENLSFGALLLVLDRRVEADAWLRKLFNIATAEEGGRGHAQGLLSQKTLLGTETSGATQVSEARALAGWPRARPNMGTEEFMAVEMADSAVRGCAEQSNGSNKRLARGNCVDWRRLLCAERERVVAEAHKREARRGAGRGVARDVAMLERSREQRVVVVCLLVGWLRRHLLSKRKASRLERSAHSSLDRSLGSG